MARYVLVQSRDAFTTTAVARDLALAAALAAAQNDVTVFLIQDGVMAARRGPHAEPLAALARLGVRVLADDFSLRVRGIADSRLAAGVKVASVEVVLDAMVEGCKAVWH